MGDLVDEGNKSLLIHGMCFLQSRIEVALLKINFTTKWLLNRLMYAGVLEISC